MVRKDLPGRIPFALIVLLTTALTAASAAPVLPSSSIASQAVRSALAADVVPVASSAGNAALIRAQGVNRATEAVSTRRTGRSALVHSTAYNSTPGQTDATPFITATGTHVHPGVVALSRDLLQRFPYGTRISIEDLSGRYSNALQGRTFVVEDTMNVRISNTVDVWMGSWNEAMAWGFRNVRIMVLQ